MLENQKQKVSMRKFVTIRKATKHEKKEQAPNA